jgi:hypothetical protein
MGGKSGDSAVNNSWENSGANGSGNNDANGVDESGWAKNDNVPDAPVSSGDW